MRDLQYREPPDESLQQLHDAHENHRTRLAILRDLLTRPGPGSDEQVAVQASYLVRDLREHMAAEEQRLFPLIDEEGVVQTADSGADEAVFEMAGLA
jgi:iron-sulfur cluster repair protein YtfE (RIC family)